LRLASSEGKIPGNDVAVALAGDDGGIVENEWGTTGNEEEAVDGAMGRFLLMMGYNLRLCQTLRRTGFRTDPDEISSIADPCRVY
jgi:hypothetical protein